MGDVAASPTRRAVIVAFRIGGALMVAVGLAWLYLAYLTTTDGFGR